MARAARPASSRPLLRRAVAAALLLGLAIVAPAAPGAPSADGKLRLVIILTRHGVRRPLAKDAYLSRMAAEPWPGWEVPPGFMTPRGERQMAAMGAYYRALYEREGLLTGLPGLDARRIVFHSDNDERSLESSRRLASTLIPGESADIRSVPPDRKDPLFQPVLVPVGRPDVGRAVAQVRARIPEGVPALLREHRAEGEILDRILLGERRRAGSKARSLFSMEPMIGRTPGSDALVTVAPIHACMSTIEQLLLEYEDGKPMSEVGWGRASVSDLYRLLELHHLYWDLAQMTPYVAQVQGSNLASHILATLDQAAGRRPLAAGLAEPQRRLVILEGHDTNLIVLAGLLHLSWRLPGTPPNPVFPAGALVFELRDRGPGSGLFLRVHYLADPPERIRAGHVPTLESPPCVVPVPIPGCSGAQAPFDAPYERARAAFLAAIDPDFVAR
jgi:4-phytase / acid phosphatase